MARILFCSSVVKVHDSQAYREIGLKREHINHILELGEMLVSFKSGFNLVNAVVACAILKSISGLEPKSDTTEPRYLKLMTVSIFCPFILISLLMPLVFFYINLVFSALLSMP